MVILTLKKVDFLKKVGLPKNTSDKEVQTLLWSFGLELDEVTTKKDEYINMNRDQLIKKFELKKDATNEEIFEYIKKERIRKDDEEEEGEADEI